MHVGDYSDIPGVTGAAYGGTPSVIAPVSVPGVVTKAGKASKKKASKGVVAPDRPASVLTEPLPQTGKEKMKAWLDSDIYFAGKYFKRKYLVGTAAGGILLFVLLSMGKKTAATIAGR